MLSGISAFRLASRRGGAAAASAAARRAALPTAGVTACPRAWNASPSWPASTGGAAGLSPFTTAPAKSAAAAAPGGAGAGAASSSSAEPPKPGKASKAGKAAVPRLTWPEYFAERAKRRRRTVAFSYVGSPAAFGYTFYSIANAISYGVEDTVAGMPAMPVYFGCTFVAALAAASLAPSILETFWRITHPTRSRSIDVLDKEFYSRIVKHRADASMASISMSGSATLYDYYGEKITSVPKYRVWMRKQNKLKKSAGVAVGGGHAASSGAGAGAGAGAAKDAADAAPAVASGADAFNPLKLLEQQEREMKQKRQH